MGGWANTLQKFLARPVDVSSLAMFRLLFGALMVWEVIRYFQHDFIGRYYIEPHFFFTYELFPFVAPLPGQGMYWLFGAMGLFALGIALGFYHRLSSFLFFVSYTYVFLLDKTPYNNHYYLISLLSFLLFTTDAHRWATLDHWRKPTADPAFIPFWQLFILRAQMVIVYFYGGLAKLNSDWLIGEPMRAWLAERADYPILGPFFTTETAVYFFSYGGLLFDLSIGFLLLWRPTRLPAFVGLVFFHLMNSWLFSIGIFPFLALASTLLFVEPDQPRRVFDWLRHRFSSVQTEESAVNLPSGGLPGLSPWLISFVLLYLALQLLIPLRHWLYPGEVSWTEEGHRFAWHMKLRDKDPRLEIKIINPTTGEVWNADLQKDLTQEQINKMGIRPDMILQYVHHLKKNLWLDGLDNPIIIANAWASLNGRPFQQLIDPRVNLAQVDPAVFAHAPWILPLYQELPHSRQPTQAGLTLVVVFLTNLGLALAAFFIIRYQRNLAYSTGVNHLHQGSSASSTLTLSPTDQASLIKLMTNLLLALIILFCLAGWTITDQPLYLGVALSAAILAAGWGLYLPPLLSPYVQRPSFLVWLSPLISLLTGLFLLILLIIGF